MSQSIIFILTSLVLSNIIVLAILGLWTLRTRKKHVLKVQALEHEVGEHKKAEDRFRALLESAPDALVSVHQDGNIEFVNRQMEKLFGYARDELIGKPIEMLIPDPLHSRHQAHRESYFAEPQVRGMGVGLDLYALRKNGSQFPVEISLSPIKTPEGVVIASAVRDVTERKRAEEAIQTSERLLRLLAQNSPDVIYILDLIEHRAIYLNRSEFLGYSHSEIEEPGSLLKAIHPEDKDRITSLWRETMIDGKLRGAGPVEFRIQDKNGEWQWVQSRETTLASTDGTPTQVLVTMSTITARKQSEQQARESGRERERHKLLSDFIRDVSHDFRTPLAIINSSLYLLMKASTPEKKVEHLSKAELQVLRLTRLLDRLLMSVRLDSEPAFIFQRIDVNRLISDFCKIVGVEAKDKAITFHSSLWEGSLMVQADHEELNLAFAELGQNALQYSSPSGTITIRTEQQGDQALIEVSDTGSGIPGVDLPYIFQRLYRVDKARSLETGGAGLGLSIAKQIIELHQGDIVVESIVGEGTTFRVLLPLSQQS